jgi:hypothetical protein
MPAVADTLLRAVDQRLSRLLALEDDWDSYGGKSPTATVVLRAGWLTQSAYDRYGPAVGEAALPTSVSPLAYGGVELQWEGTGSLVALDIGSDGAIGSMLRRGIGQQAVYVETEDLDWEQALDRIGEILGAPS